MLALSDYVSLHVPLNKNTQGLVSDEFLEKMKPGALLLNYARGPVVDEDALLRALEAGHLAGYITDFPSEKIIGHDKILISPHLGASTKEAQVNVARAASEQVRDYLLKGEARFALNKS